jgi:solute carrier family 25 phosphate transporter 3
MYREEGMRGLVKGWAPTVVGYSLQGLGKFGFYEFFKHFYSNILGEVSLSFLFYLIILDKCL